MKKPTAPKKVAPAAPKTGASAMMISGKSTGTVNPTSQSALGKMPASTTAKKIEPALKQAAPAAPKKEETKVV